MLRTLFVYGIVIPGVLLALFSRYRALLLYMWLTFFRPQEFMWMSTYGQRWGLFCGLILVVPAFLTGAFPNVMHPLSVGFILFIFSGLLAQFNEINQDLGWYWLDYTSRLFLVCLLAVTLIKTPRDWLRVLAVAAGSIGFYATKAGLNSILFGGVRYSEGLGGSFSDNNGYALGTVMIIPMLILIVANAELMVGRMLPKVVRYVRFIGYLAVPLCVYTVISTFSRGGFLALIAIVLATLTFHPRRVRIFLVLTILIAAFIKWVPLPQGYTARLGSLEQVDVNNPQEDAAEGRIHFWEVAMLMVQAHPLGVGMRGYQDAYPRFDTKEGAYGGWRDVHSSHFQVLSELGYLGGLVWIIEFVLAFRYALRVRRRARDSTLDPATKKFFIGAPTALIVSMAGFIVGGSFISSALNELTWLTFALLASLDLMSKRLCAEAAEPVKVVAPVPVRSPFQPAPGIARTAPRPAQWNRGQL